ncbi:sulfotransferase family 2 domain-containing protein [Roseibium album]|uniref:sulfotransferase family 2 domain-containing protein n=1 Tax=Roseibium album TaxID=311410 RepID=UPI0024925EA5|nr:sulfotransferase family 2 domain-containing protein [Roseibium album]
MDEYQLKNFLKFAPSRLGLVPKKHLFIHIPKNGGMSIRHEPQLTGRIILTHRRRLKGKSYADGLKNRMQAKGGQPGYEHARYRDVDVSVRKATIAFAVVRNPWSRTVSRFKFALQTRGNRNKSGLTYDQGGFEAFLDERHTWGGEDYFWHRAIRGWYPQVDYLIDEDNRIAVDVLRQEHLAEEMGRYLSLRDELKPRNVSKVSGSDYRELYTDKTIQVIADWYAADVDRFGFDFDTSAVRNTHFCGAQTQVEVGE